MKAKELLNELENLIESGNLTDFQFEAASIIKDILTNYNEEETIDVEEIFSDCIDNIRETKEIINYSDAMEFLTEHDFTLEQSLEIADDLDYHPCDLDSKILASLLYQEFLIQEARNILNKIVE